MIPSQTDLKALFLEALERPEGPERAAFLDAACRGEASLHAQVEELLEAHVRAGGFLGSASETTAEGDPGLDNGEAAAPTGSIAEGPGSRIGPYTIIRRLGEGGMGIVFLAEQERPVHRKVALKVIKPGMDTEQVVARFEAERQALALMDHPGIARVFDAGATDSGRPFFVMELVDGVPINEYCDRERLSPRHRLELFVAVCRAIEHAHHKGIIHRDIKPSNVLVTLIDGEPVPKLIDFGVAKAIDQRLTERTLFTQFGALVGTPEYMSPEQADNAGAGIDTRSDVYALGVLLYELLTGTTPLGRVSLLEAAFSEVLRRIREEEPARPSTRLSNSGDSLASIAACRDVEPSRLTRLVRGDLDWITMKALEKDRRRRYATALELGQDVQRHLDGDPVEASPPSPTRYRAGQVTRGSTGRPSWVAAGALMMPGRGHAGRFVAACSAACPAAGPIELLRSILKDHERTSPGASPSRPTASGWSARGATGMRAAGELRGYLLGAGKPVPAYRAEEPHGIRWVAFAPDGETLATGEYDGMVRMRDAATGKVLARLLVTPGAPAVPEVHLGDGRTLVTCGKDSTIKIWDVATRGLKATMAGPADVRLHARPLVQRPDYC